MNRFIHFAKKSPSVPFRVAIYRDDRAYSGYIAVRYPTLLFRQIAQNSFFNDAPVRKLNG